jgi:hypothetical protein
MYLVAHLNPAWGISNVDSRRWTGSQKITIPASLDYMGKFRSYGGNMQMPQLNTGFIFCWVLFGI